MKSVQFIFGIHNHQPVGNFDGVFQHACDHSYLPFLQELEKHPSISMAIHFSGSLIEWLDENRPEILDLLAKLVQRGNIEILGSGFYEPILAMIPRNDRIGQLKMMTDYAQKRFKYDVAGSWLTERVWEPHLAYSLVEGGIDYVVVDDYHFLSAGLKSHELTGYFHTEQESNMLGVFPISQRLRYSIPFEDPQVTIDYLRQFATEAGDQVLVMADDGEKFGLWPGTYQSVYGEGWLSRFFGLLEENTEWLKTTTFKQYHASQPSRGLVYLPTASYFEMSQWTLPTDLGRDLDRLVHDLADMDRAEESRPFIKGGMWRNFLSKYSESNWMQKRVQELSNRIQKYEEAQATTVDKTIRADLYRAQCNCAFWHGVFGGLYLPHLRHAIYEHLLSAETAFNLLEARSNTPIDLDYDGSLERVLGNQQLQVLVSQTGGHIREIDWLPAHFNITNFIQRYSESYHEKLAHASTGGSTDGSIHDLVLAKEEGLQDKLFIDGYTRRNAVDHILDADANLQNYYRGRLQNRLTFRNPRFESEQEGLKINLTGHGQVDGQSLQIDKKYTLKGSTLIIAIQLRNQSDVEISGRYGLEFNLGLLGGDSPDRYFQINGNSNQPLNTQQADAGVTQVSLTNEWDGFRIDLNFAEPVDLWRAPIETISMSEAGFERVYQASSILPQWSLNLDPGAEQEFALELALSSLKQN